MRNDQKGRGGEANANSGRKEKNDILGGGEGEKKTKTKNGEMNERRGKMGTMASKKNEKKKWGDGRPWAKRKRAGKRKNDLQGGFDGFRTKGGRGKATETLTWAKSNAKGQEGIGWKGKLNGLTEKAGRGGAGKGKRKRTDRNQNQGWVPRRRNGYQQTSGKRGGGGKIHIGSERNRKN